jgi:hypothetical protein
VAVMTDTDKPPGPEFPESNSILYPFIRNATG